jgi:hypothetical protein
MRILLILCLSLWVPVYPTGTLQTFTSQDGVFQFKYPSVLVRCTEKQTQEGDACNRQDQICSDAGSSTVTIACFAYPKADFKDKPEFSAAGFFVAPVQAATTRESCLVRLSNLGLGFSSSPSQNLSRIPRETRTQTLKSSMYCLPPNRA